MARNAKPAPAPKTSDSDQKVVEEVAAVDAAKVTVKPKAAEPSVSSDATTLDAAAAGDIAKMGDEQVAELRDALTEVVAVVAVVIAPRGPRRRAGHAFGPLPIRLPLADLSPDELAAITEDPMLKVAFEGMDEDEAAQAVE